jgi:hypothetical protein
MAGLPDAPRVFVPMPVMGKTTEELRAYVNGKDPITGKPVMQEVVAGLTTALAGSPARVSHKSAVHLTSPNDCLSSVVPAKAGTHTPFRCDHVEAPDKIEKTRRVGPRFRASSLSDLRDKRSNRETNGIDESIFSNEIPP